MGDAMAWPVVDEPTWTERQGYGPRLTLGQGAMLIQQAEQTYDLGWRHVHFLATMWAESRLHAWARPMVWAPLTEHHLSVDRGVCALNSYWWHHVDDEQAYTPSMAIRAAIVRVRAWADEGAKGSTTWDWRPVIDWQWHAYGGDDYTNALGLSRDAINVVRANGHNLSPI